MEIKKQVEPLAVNFRKKKFTGCKKVHKIKKNVQNFIKFSRVAKIKCIGNSEKFTKLYVK